MPDLLTPDLNPAIYERLRQAAADQGKSLAQTARSVVGKSRAVERGDLGRGRPLAPEDREGVGNSTADIRDGAIMSVRIYDGSEADDSGEARHRQPAVLYSSQGELR